MAILALGVSHRHAPVAVLERLAFSDDHYAKAYARALGDPAIGEVVILSTCNRVEVHARVAGYHGGFQALKRLLAETREVNHDDFAEALYAHYEGHAVEHLFRVAAGLDSMVVGEPQILRQVRNAFRRAEAEGAAGSDLGPLFRAAIRTGRRARTETAIGASPGTLIRVGLEEAERVLGPITDRAAVVVGAGEMARLAVAALRDRDVGPVRILNRTAEPAARLARRIGGTAGTLGELGEAIAWADLVVSSTGSPGVLIERDLVVRALARERRSRPLFVLDLAVPRDVDPSVAQVEGVSIAGIQDLADLATRGREDLAAEVARVDAIVRQEVDRFQARRRSARLAPVIRALRERGARIEAAELARLGPRLDALSDRERDAVTALAGGIVAKLLHQPIVRLKALSDRGEEDAMARAVAELFDLDIPVE